MIERNKKAREGLKERREESVGVFMLSLPIALFLVAGRMAVIGREEGFSLAELLAAFVIASVLLPLVAYTARKVIAGEGKEKKSFWGRAYLVLLGLTVSALAFYTAVIGTLEMMDFAIDVVLLKTPRMAVALIFLALVAYLSRCGSVTLRKISLSAAVFVFAGSLLLFVLSLPMIDSGELWELAIKEHPFSAGGVGSAFVRVFAPVAVAVIYISVALGRRLSSSRTLATSWGLILGGGVLTVCFLNSLLILGASMGDIYGYPYVAAVSTVTAGKLFARMDGLLYMMYFGAATVRAAVSVSLICLVAGRAMPVKRESRRLRLLPVLVCLLVAASVLAIESFAK